MADQALSIKHHKSIKNLSLKEITEPVQAKS